MRRANPIPNAGTGVNIGGGGGGGLVPPPNVHTEMEALPAVTAPLRAMVRPLTLVPVVIVTLVNAMTVPRKFVPVPNVAELPTCQNTLQLCAPLTKFTLAPLAVVSALPTLNTKRAAGSPCPLSVTAPVRPMVELEQ